MRQESILLTKEIITHIMGNVGFVPPPNFGIAGASQDNFMIDKYISVSDGDNTKKCSVWGAETKFTNSTFRVLFSDLTTDDKITDYLLVLRVDAGPVHAMNLSFYDGELSNYFLIFDDKNKSNTETDSKYKMPDIAEASTYDKCMALAGIELITQAGVDWIEIVDYDDLFVALTKLSEK